jgi:hypothetical protein
MGNNVILSNNEEPDIVLFDQQTVQTTFSNNTLEVIVDEQVLETNVEQQQNNLVVDPSTIFGGIQTINAGKNIVVNSTNPSVVEVATVDDPDFTGINLDTVNPITISTAGQLAWNELDGTVDIGLKNNIKLKTGQQLYFYGKAQGTITKRDVVQFAGFQGDHILIKKAVGAEIEAFPEGLIGVAKQSLTNGQFGYVTWFGEVAEISTTGWTVGDILYFNNVTGGLTNVAPTAPNRRIVIAAVEKLATGMAQNGVILVRPSFGLKLKELDDVNGTALTTTGQILSYNASTGYFDFTENINNKQNTLVSGTNIKTINNQSILGSGNLTISGGSATESFETVSKNLKSWGGTLNYTGGVLSSIVYTDGVDTITKTFNYTGGVLTSVVLSGDTPAGIDLTKTLGYTSGNLTLITYS